MSTQLKPSPNDNTLPIPSDDDVISTWFHRAWATFASITLLIPLYKCLNGASHSHNWAGPILAGVFGFLLVDFVSAFVHWGIDNYGNFSTPIFGGLVEAFEAHHRKPWTTTQRQFANNLYAPARFVPFMVLPLALAFDEPIFHAFVTVFFGCILFSQQIHAWAHEEKGRLPLFVPTLHYLGIFLSFSHHSLHHRHPFNKRYSVISGMWDDILDKHKVYETMENFLFSKFGVKPRSWNEPASDLPEKSSTT